jgi:uncharacterized RDD family membrane protein YckC
MSDGQPQAAFPSAEQPASKVYAGLWLRVCAWAVDVAILILASFVYFMVLSLPIFYLSEPGFVLGGFWNLPTEERESYWGLLYIPLWAIYYGTFESSSRRGTLGKQLLRIRVVDREGQQLTVGKAVIRVWPQYLLFAAPAMGTYLDAERASAVLMIALILITMAMIALTERRQGLHDIVTGCLVVRRGADMSQLADRQMTK